SVTIPNITPSQNTPVLPNMRRIVTRPSGASCSRRNSAKPSLATILRPPFWPRAEIYAVRVDFRHVNAGPRSPTPTTRILFSQTELRDAQLSLDERTLAPAHASDNGARAMTSEAKIRANRLNALKSTGPKTARGKSMMWRNAVTHGMTATRVVLFDETKADFEKFYAGLAQDFAPEGTAECALVERIAMLAWRLRRARRAGDAMLNSE